MYCTTCSLHAGITDLVEVSEERVWYSSMVLPYLHTRHVFTPLGKSSVSVHSRHSNTCSSYATKSHVDQQHLHRHSRSFPCDQVLKRNQWEEKDAAYVFKPLRSGGERNFYKIVRRWWTKRTSVFQTVFYYCPSVIYGLFVAKLLPYTHFSLKLWKKLPTQIPEEEEDPR